MWVTSRELRNFAGVSEMSEEKYYKKSDGERYENVIIRGWTPSGN